MKVIWMRVGGGLGALGVLLGAIGAHGPMHEALVAGGRLNHWETAVQYHLLHAVAMVALAAGRHRASSVTLACWAGGIAFFSGSLYGLACSGVRWLGAITPLGGMLFIAGWLWLSIRPPAGGE